jgi:RimJ/RimL family protein N-acetyltransferase
MSRWPPERIDLGEILLRRPTTVDATLIADALADELDHLRPWMPWATPDNVTVDAQRARLEQVEQSWHDAQDHNYTLMDAQEASVLGSFGLHRRIGPDAIEIGYWLSHRVTGNGYATRATEALTRAALELDDVSRVEIHCDEANVRSAKIPQRLGYRLDRIEPDEIEAPGEIGRSMIWVYPPNVSQAEGSPER